MPTFDTPAPISITVEIVVGDLRITASDRTDTIVEVRPSDPTKQSDVTAAQENSRRVRERRAAREDSEGVAPVRAAQGCRLR